MKLTVGFAHTIYKQSAMTGRKRGDTTTCACDQGRSATENWQKSTDVSHLRGGGGGGARTLSPKYRTHCVPTEFSKVVLKA